MLFRNFKETFKVEDFITHFFAVCIRLTYLKKDAEILFAITVDGKTVISKKLSGMLKFR